jgi:hypothetical protein
MSRYLTLLLCTLAVVAGCSRNPERSSAAGPTTPSATTGLAPEPGSLLGPTSVAPGGISGKFDVVFPPRNEPFDFFNQLETKYRTGLGRAPAPTFVDAEGRVVWTQEYLRYRVNGCDHGTGVLRVIAQIDGHPAGGVCGAPPDGLIQFPPRQDALDFDRQLDSKYRQFGRAPTLSAVDAEGAVIWIQEYLRYRVNQCNHSESVVKIFSQIDGGGVAPTCFVPPPCSFTAAPSSQSVPASGGTFTITVTRVGSACDWRAESLGSFVNVTSGAGTDTGTVTYTVAPNTGPARSTQIRVRWLNGSTLVDINQAEASLSASVVLIDPSQSTGATSVCQIRSTATQCQLVASADISAPSVFTWTVTYNYGTAITKTQSSTSNVFTFTETCGGPGSSSGGTDAQMNVTLSVADPNKGTTTVNSAFTIRFFTC